VVAFHSFEELEVWKLSCRLAIRLYADLRDCADRGLKDQMTRAAVSIASNIAEGSERTTGPDFVRFLSIAKGSAAELRTQVYIAARVGILSNQQHIQLTTDLKQVSAMLHSLSKSIQAKAATARKTRTLNTEHRTPNTVLNNPDSRRHENSRHRYRRFHRLPRRHASA
jgi:four helix bundle protein